MQTEAKQCDLLDGDHCGASYVQLAVRVFEGGEPKRSGLAKWEAKRKDKRKAKRKGTHRVTAIVVDLPDQVQSGQVDDGSAEDETLHHVHRTETYQKVGDER